MNAHYVTIPNYIIVSDIFCQLCSKILSLAHDRVKVLLRLLLRCWLVIQGVKYKREQRNGLVV